MSPTAWQYGGFVDVGYLRDFNEPSNHLFRSRGTTFQVNEWDLNMAVAYVRKKASEQSRWGTELLVQGGKDQEAFGFSATAPNLAGADWMSHLGLANLSYLAPVGTGLTVQAGIFGSLIGYDSLYAKDNFNYTRPWGADYTPYLMLGVNVAYPLTERLTVAGGAECRTSTESAPAPASRNKARPPMTTESEPLTRRTRLGPSDPKKPASAQAANSAGPTTSSGRLVGRGTSKCGRSDASAPERRTTVSEMSDTPTP